VEDLKIVELYWERDERAISQTEKKYGKYCHSIALGILRNELDAEECVNDVYLRVWESIPPHRPDRLPSFIGKITRNVSINRYIRDRAQKRNGFTEVIFDEVAEIIPDPQSASDAMDDQILSDAINAFLATLPKRTRIIFVRRYWYMSTVADIADALGLSESNVKVTLLRTRKKLRAYLLKEGINV
jgi:RNA polymerase sigma-70 factor (ECF subfamily)